MLIQILFAVFAAFLSVGPLSESIQNEASETKVEFSESFTSVDYYRNQEPRPSKARCLFPISIRKISIPLLENAAHRLVITTSHNALGFPLLS